jgi:DNA-binding transcriptional MerR regulator
MTTAQSRERTIGEVAVQTGLSIDSLRWFEREGLFPAIRRNAGGQRRFSDSDVERIVLMLRLRRTGMPVKDMRRFIELLQGGEETHAERLRLLLAQRARIQTEQQQLAEDLAAVDFKIAYYTGQIGASDCEALAADSEAKTP